MSHRIDTDIESFLIEEKINYLENSFLKSVFLN